MKHVYMLAILVALSAIFIQLGFIHDSLQDWRPVRTYHFNDQRRFDVSSVDRLEICDRMATQEVVSK